MALQSLKVSAAAVVAGQPQPGTVQVRSVKVARPQTTNLVLLAGGGQVGPQLRPWVAKSADYTLLQADGGALVTATCTITLPPLPIIGQLYGVKAYSDGVLPSVSTGTSGVIDAGTINSSVVEITEAGACVMFTLAPNGTDWLIAAVSSYVPLTPLAPAPIPPDPVIS